MAVDIGASSGRHILGCVKSGKIILEEIYRFNNGISGKDGHLCWDIDTLFEEILNGLCKCREVGKIPVCMGIDTWGVDFVLLDGFGNRIGDAVAYRDSRTNGMDTVLSELITAQELYEKTGIQKQSFNTIYQLMAMKREQSDVLTHAETLLMIPDYFNYLLTSAVASTARIECGISLSKTLIFCPYALLTVAVISFEMFVRGITIVMRMPSIRSFGLICSFTIDTERSKGSKPFAER